MKALIAMAVAAGFMGAMSLAQAGVPVSVEASVGKTVGAHETPDASAKGDRGTSTGRNQNAAKPTIPGAREAQSKALSNGQQMAIVGGVILVAGVALLVSDNGNGNGNNSTTPGTGGSTGTTGTN